jgi:hypothetical protein
MTVHQGTLATQTTSPALEPEIQQWLAGRKAAGAAIDIETCEITWWYAETMDSYGCESDLPEELQQVGRCWFVRSPNSGGWIVEGDLPSEKREQLGKRIDRDRRESEALCEEAPDLAFLVEEPWVTPS